MKTIITCGGGGARGIWAAGALKALRDLGIEYDVIIGSSVGALNASMFFVGAIDAMANIWLNIKTSDVCRFAPWKIFSESCFYDVSPLRKLIESHVDIYKIDAVKNRKLFVNATDIKSWTPVCTDAQTCKRESELVDLLMASAAAPIAFPPVNGMYDAGLTANYSIAEAVALGAERIICLVASVPEQTVIKNIGDAFDIVTALPEYNQLTSETHFVQKLNKVPGFRKIELVIIRPSKPTGIQLLDFDYKGKDRKAIIEDGYKTAIAALKDEPKPIDYAVKAESLPYLSPLHNKPHYHPRAACGEVSERKRTVFNPDISLVDCLPEPKPETMADYKLPVRIEDVRNAAKAMIDRSADVVIARQLVIDALRRKNISRFRELKDQKVMNGLIEYFNSIANNVAINTEELSDGK